MPYKFKRDKLAHDTAYQSTPIQKRRRAARNRSVRKIKAANGNYNSSKLDVHHKDGNPENTSPSNMELRSHKQRGIKRA
jgi:hypothetical protein|tara:strand:- start:387 stop:623 length:237 start_codon:yes stop_codon:yes gene_type:complete